MKEWSNILVRVSRFNPPYAAEACQLATGLNRRKPSLSLFFYWKMQGESGICSHDEIMEAREAQSFL
jgi:hypothetical protein